LFPRRGEDVDGFSSDIVFFQPKSGAKCIQLKIPIGFVTSA
jgi:hypothetical protein